MQRRRLLGFQRARSGETPRRLPERVGPCQVLPLKAPSRVMRARVVIGGGMAKGMVASCGFTRLWYALVVKHGYRATLPLGGG